MRRLMSLLAADARFQARHGFYLVYGLVTVVYVMIIRLIPASWRVPVLPFFLFSDPTFIGLMLSGGCVLLEREQGVVRALAVTPGRAAEMLGARLLGYALPGALMAAFLTLAGGRPDAVPAVVAVVLLSSPLYTLAGLAVAARVKTVNQYMMALAPFLLVSVLPALSVYGLVTHPLLRLLPGWGTLQALRSLTDPAIGGLLPALLQLTLWLAAAFLLGARPIARRLIGGTA